MALLDRIVKANFVPPGYGPKFKVYDYWYNILVDKLNDVGTLGRVDSDQLSGLPLCGLPSTLHIFLDDFDKGIAAAGLEACWTVTETDAGNTEVIVDGNGGIITLTNGAADDDSASQIQKIGENFQLVAGKELWYEARVYVYNAAADVTNLDFFVGLAETEDLTAVADNMPANGVGFRKTDAGVGTVFLTSSDNGTNIVSAAAITTIASGTWIRLGFYFNGGATGAATITPYVNGVAGNPITSVTYATMTALSPIFMVRNGDAVSTQILSVDYVYIVQER